MNHRKLFIVYNRAISKARHNGNNPKLIQRINLALGILQHHDYYVQDKEQYQPTPHSCNCKDWQYHGTNRRGYRGHCKHMIAEILLERVSQVTYHQLSFIGG